MAASNSNTLEQTADIVLQDELVRNERIVQHPTYGAIRLSRPTPRKERLIAEIRRKQYQSDLMDASILSRAQLEKIASERGMWAPEKTERMQDLSRRVGEIIGALDSIGYQDLDSLLEEYHQVQDQLMEHFPGDEGGDMREAIRRYFNLDETPDRKLRIQVLKAAPNSTVDDLVAKGDLLRTQADLLMELGKSRRELNELQVQHSRLFVDSIESRADRAEELAQVYYCAEKETGGPIFPAFDDIMDQAPEDIEHLVVEMFYFINGITDEFKRLLSKHSFIRRGSDIVKQSDDSPVPPQTSSDGESPEKTSEDSSE